MRAAGAPRGSGAGERPLVKRSRALPTDPLSHTRSANGQADPKKDAKKDPKKDKKGGGDEPPAEEQKIAAVFIPAIEAAVQEFVAKWQVRVCGCGGAGAGVRVRVRVRVPACRPASAQGSLQRSNLCL